MASKTRRTTKCFTKPNQENTISFFQSENTYLRQKNDDLAKALAEARIEQQKQSLANHTLNKHLYAINAQRNKYEVFYDNLSLEVKMYVQHFLSMAEQLTILLAKVKDINVSSESLNDVPGAFSNNFSTGSPAHKTAAVMPMVEGHTISNPKINLRRVTAEELTDMMNASRNPLGEADTYDEAEQMERDDDEDGLPSGEDFSQDALEVSHEPRNRRLETMLEADEEQVEQSNISQQSQPVLSGVFRDVKVYISPLPTQHLIQFSGNTPRTLNRLNYSTNNTASSTLTPQQSVNRTDIEHSNYSSRTLGNNSSEQSEVNEMRKFQPIRITKQPVTEEFDSMEGPSSKFNNTGNASFSSPPKETSTPCTFQASMGNVSGNQTSEVATPRNRRVNVNIRRGSNRNCSVIIDRLATNTIEQFTSRGESQSESHLISNRGSRRRATLNRPKRERSDSPTVLETSHRSSSGINQSRRERGSSESSCFSDSSVRRTRRNVRPITYKEPSLTKKLRR